MNKLILASCVALGLGSSVLSVADELVPARQLTEQIQALDAQLGPDSVLAHPWFICSARNMFGRRFYAEGRWPEETQRRAYRECRDMSGGVACHEEGCRPRR